MKEFFLYYYAANFNEEKFHELFPKRAGVFIKKSAKQVNLAGCPLATKIPFHSIMLPKEIFAGNENLSNNWKINVHKNYVLEQKLIVEYVERHAIAPHLSRQFAARIRGYLYIGFNVQNDCNYSASAKLIEAMAKYELALELFCC